MLSDPRRGLKTAGILGCLTLLMFGLVWSTTTRDALQWVDERFLSLMENLRWSPLVSVAKVLAFVGSAYVTWVVRVGVLAILARRKHWVHLAAFALAVVTSEALVGTTKALFDRARPAGSLIATSGASFPSGHAIAAAVTAVGLVIVLLPPGSARWK